MRQRHWFWLGLGSGLATWLLLLAG